MSSTIPTPPAIRTAAQAITAATDVSTLASNLRTAAQNGARDVPEAIKALAVIDPDLSTYLAGKSALGSKTLIAPIVLHVLTWAVGYYGLNWDAGTTESVAGLVSIVVMGALRFVTSTPITSLLPKPTA